MKFWTNICPDYPSVCSHVFTPRTDRLPQKSQQMSQLTCITSYLSHGGGSFTTSHLFVTITRCHKKLFGWQTRLQSPTERPTSCVFELSYFESQLRWPRCLPRLSLEIIVSSACAMLQTKDDWEERLRDFYHLVSDKIDSRPFFKYPLTTNATI